MPGEATLTGMVVDKKPDDPFPVRPNEGLYLLTEKGKAYRLIRSPMYTQEPADILHGRSRQDFEPYLDKEVKVRGYLSNGTIWGAIIVD